MPIKKHFATNNMQLRYKQHPMILLRKILVVNLGLFLLLSQRNCLNAQVYEVKEISINSGFPDFGPVKYQNGIVFCSSRSGKRVMGNIDSTVVSTDLFFSSLDAMGNFSNPIIFSPELKGKLNEGPATFSNDFKTIYFTANIIPELDTSAVETKYPLGIFKSQFVNGKWSSPEPFQFNSKDLTYDVAHPALSQDGTLLFFTSNMPGGYGQSDIYCSKLENGTWQTPFNLGEEVNTPHSELFPYEGKNGFFYFSSNGYHDEADLDILITKRNKMGEWMKPRALPGPINSSFNDYSYVEDNTENNGYISSDRSGGDNIYSFIRRVPHFVDCQENQGTVLCYEFEDTELQPLTNSPLEYHWDLGDGTIVKGLRAKHCYKQPGEYVIKLHLLDTITKQSIMDVSSTILSIKEIHQPFILSADSAVIMQKTSLYADTSPIKHLNLDKTFWIIDNTEVYYGDSIQHTFNSTGMHTVLCGSTSKPQADGSVLKSCSTKKIQVVAEGEELVQNTIQQKNDSVKTINTKEFTEKFVDSEKGTPLYRIILVKSIERIPMNAQEFSKLEDEIVETKSEDGTYTYSVGASAEIEMIYERLKRLQAKSGVPYHIESFNRDQFNAEYIRTGKYIEKGDASLLNIEFNKLQDIKFEYNSADIKEESYANLDYIAAMLKLEEDFHLRINAHTCSQGSHAYNTQLSKKRAESVKKYFVKKGISAKKLITKGYAETQPIADNNTEEGKSQNRRVEFVIIFKTLVNE